MRGGKEGDGEGRQMKGKRDKRKRVKERKELRKKGNEEQRDLK